MSIASAERLACLSIPGFAREVLVKERPRLDEGPLIVAEREGDSSPLAALNRWAVQEELSPSMTVAQARGRCPDLRVIIRNPEREDEESGKLLKQLQAIGPFVEEDLPGRYFIQAAGLTRLYKSENRLAQKILTDLSPTEYPLHVGVAANKLVSRIAADISDIHDYTIVPARQEKYFLAPLTIRHLSLPIETVETLHSLGIKTIKQLAAFPPHEITHRFGQEVIQLAHFARGHDKALFVPENVTAELSHRLVLDYPIRSSTRLLTHIEPMLEELLGMLSVSGRGCQTLVLGFGCDDKSKTTLQISVDQPSASTHLFARQIYRRLERQTLQAGIIDVRVMIPQTIPLATQQLTIDRQPADNNCVVTDSKGTIKLPPDLYSIETQPHTLPESSHRLKPFVLPKRKNGKRKTAEAVLSGKEQLYAIRPICGLRLLTPPREIRVAIQSGRIGALCFKKRSLPVVGQSGPWKLSGNWWCNTVLSGLALPKAECDLTAAPAPFDRLYYEIDTSDNRAFLLYHDRKSSAWFLQGVFD